MPETLNFHFTPVDTPRPDQANPHAKASTHVPEVVEALRAQFGEAIQDLVVYAGEHTVYLEKATIVEVCRFLKQEQGFDYLGDVGAFLRRRATHRARRAL